MKLLAVVYAGLALVVFMVMGIVAFFYSIDSLYADRGRVDDPHLWQRAERLGLDLERFEADRRSEAVAARVRRDFESGIRAGVTATPAVFPM